MAVIIKAVLVMFTNYTDMNPQKKYIVGIKTEKKKIKIKNLYPFKIGFTNLI